MAGSSRSNQHALKAKHKHEIRQAFHAQLRHLWRITDHLRYDEPNQTGRIQWGRPGPQNTKSGLAARYVRGAYHLVPLVTEELGLWCELEVLLLRPEAPALLHAGDLDNRLKTLFDAFRLPTEGELVHLPAPDEGEDPFFCLLADDKLITKVSLETDTLLEKLGGRRNSPNDARVIITVKLAPRLMTPDNIRFG